MEGSIEAILIKAPYVSYIAVWKPLAAGTLKFNIAAFNHDSGVIGIGWILQDSDNQSIGGRVCVFVVAHTPIVA